jgi:hypothetical protein
MVDRHDIKALASSREAIHRSHASSRPLSVNYEYIGLLGEACFAEEMGLELDRTARPGGDKGVDFITPLGTIDVKTARKAYNLIHEQGKAIANILVLAQYDDSTDSITFLGWEYGTVVTSRPTRDFGYRVINHFIPVKSLKPMESLKTLLASVA